MQTITKSKTKIKCLCGAIVTVNTYKTHVKSSVCNLNETDRGSVLKVLELKTKHQSAWFKKDGENAVGDVRWYKSVLSGYSNVDDWQFCSPRIMGQVTPNQRTKMAVVRLRAGNPSVKSKSFTYSKADVITYARTKFIEIENDNTLSMRSIYTDLSKKFKNFGFLFADENLPFDKTVSTEPGRGTKLLCHILGISLEAWQKMCRARRGVFIKIGQLKSEKFKAAASLSGSKSHSKWRITVPQKILFELIKSVDEKAEMEYRVTHESKSYSYDIYSPSQKCVIEMHGHFWHRKSLSKNLTIQKIVNHNLKNDKLKEFIARTILNKDIYYFWDDNVSAWREDIYKLYGKYPITIEEAENKIGKKLRYGRRV